MFAVGHLSIGYLLAKATGRPLRQELNLPLIFVLSLIPDADLLISGLSHRTVTHSIIVSTIIFLPVFALFKTRAVPYFSALAQHSIMGDFVTGGRYGQGAQLLWPITSVSYGLPIDMSSTVNIALEWSSFLVAVVIMLRTNDLQRLLKGNKAHLALSIPTITVLLPTFLYFPLSVPAALLIPHLAYLLLFMISIFNVFRTALLKRS
ncbi:MAG: metal-dependent hydrolase [Candidatus Bathyarchaeia archaeon]